MQGNNHTNPQILIRVFNRVFFFMLIVFACQSINAQEITKDILKKPIILHGNLSVQLETYHASGIEPRKKDFSWLISGNPSITLLGLQLPFSFLFSNFENRYYQPFNQFGISPSYKWARLHLGYRNLNFSPYTLAGHRIFGAGVELNPKWFRFGFIYGRLKQSASIDSSQFANPLYIRPAPTYQRMGYAIKAGVGNQKNYIDLIWFRGWDKEKSLSLSLKDSIQPAENAVTGISARLYIAKNLSLRTDVGLSAYSVNRNDAEDSTGYKEKIGKLTKPFFTNRISSRYYMAGEWGIAYQLPGWGAEILYKKIDPGYQSMGAYFFQSDIREYSLSFHARMDSGRLNLNGNLGFQKDNLDRQKNSTAKRFIGSAAINYVPSSKFGINFNFSNFGITQNPLPTAPSTLSFKQVNNSFMLLPYFNWINENTSKNLQLIATYQSLSTPQSSIGSSPDLNTWSFNTFYNHTWLKTGFNANASLNYILSKTAPGDIGSYGAGVGGLIPVLKNKLTMNAQVTWLSNTFNKEPNGHTLRATLGVNIPAGTHHNFQILGNYLKNQSDNTTVVQSFNESSVQVIYGLSF
jgi:hypothetical protein